MDVPNLNAKEAEKTSESPKKFLRTSEQLSGVNLPPSSLPEFRRLNQQVYMSAMKRLLS